MSEKEKRTLGIACVLIVLAALLPFVDQGYWLSIGVSIAMYTVLATSWALFSGPTNLISLASAAFFGVGMYVVAGGIDLLPYWILVILAGLAGAILAALVGIATLRIAGVYFVIFTLGMAELVRQIVVWGQATLGTQAGLYVLTDFTEELIFWLLLGLAAIVFFIGWWVGRSRLGFALRIIGNDEMVAIHSGINTARAKVMLFVISSTFAAITGALVAPRWSYVEPTIAFSPFISFQVVIMALLGGTGRLWGPIVGVIPFTFLWEAIAGTFPNQTTLLLGLSFLVIVYLLPKGFVGLMQSARNRVNRREGFA